MKKIIITLSIAVSILVSQEDIFEQNYSIGFDFHMFPQTFLGNPDVGGYYGDSEIVNLMGFYLSYETSSGLLIEPGYSFYSEFTEVDYESSSYDDYEYTNTWRTLSLGVFKIMEGEDVRTYVGGRIGKSWYEYDTNAEFGEDEDLDNFMIAPTFGAEYFVGENFSFGGEVMYKILTNKDTESSSTYDITSLSTSVEPKFLVRFYF